MLCGEMPDDSDKHEVVKCERVVEPTCELSDHEILQNQTEGGPALSNKDDLFIVAEEEPDNKKVIMEELLVKKEVVIVDEPLEKRDAPARGPLVEEKSVTTLKKTTRKAPPGAAKAAENRTSKTKPKSQFNVRQNLRKAPVEITIVPLSKMLSKSTAKLEREDTSRARSLKQLPVRTPRPTSSNSRNPKLERPTSSNSRNPKLQNSINMRPKERQESRSEKDAKAKNDKAPESNSGSGETNFHQFVNRPKQVCDSTKHETEKNDAGFSFKSDERAAKRKEYFMKLEEKLRAKQAVMSEFQVRTQEEREAAVKQLRKNLNFKATPMPSFYHEAAPRVSEGKLKIATPAKPQKLQSKSMDPGNRTF